MAGDLGADLAASHTNDFGERNLLFGSPLFQVGSRMSILPSFRKMRRFALSKPDALGIYVGTLDDPSNFKPEAVMFTSRGHLWDHLDPTVPKLSHMRTSP